MHSQLFALSKVLISQGYFRHLTKKKHLQPTLTNDEIHQTQNLKKSNRIELPPIFNQTNNGMESRIPIPTN